ncbi:hypothetical protein B0T26DRAFT_688084 [Lasiosphaeria miniovina]|uniref:Uncharacterized protein n=1 Tax=Lasiosphaeria miniovina TaxID=1954250 RepID=A0AA40BHH3_9PEZI|nr:uncharacterized protein B0T26DRAFT_688084 [Lasiosphaeria miniovina]KAK0734322.1 hypothetical protein B0T26DRAFT_688084 [Lasiosphaeria miniovina]
MMPIALPRCWLPCPSSVGRRPGMNRIKHAAAARCFFLLVSVDTFTYRNPLLIANSQHLDRFLPYPIFSLACRLFVCFVCLSALPCAPPSPSTKVHIYTFAYIGCL